MNKKLLMLFLGSFLLMVQAMAQQKTITGKVLDEDRLPLPGASIRIKGLPTGVSSASDGVYTINASVGQTLVFTFVGTLTQEIKVGSSNVIDVVLKNDAKQLAEVEITGAMGIKEAKRALGTSSQTVKGTEVAQTQRENFINGLQGRVAGLQVNSTSGVPGASSVITLRGISSINSNNQPLIVIDGIPADNTTFHTGELASGSALNSSFENRGIDFANRSSDFSPEDIEEYTILKGPEAAALYGIDAANGAIIITTKRGKAGTGRINYSNSFRVDQVTKMPEVQRVYDLGASGQYANTSSMYFGPKYAPGTQFYDNISDFFQTALTQKHNLSFEGGSDKATYRVSTAYTNQKGVVPNTGYDRFNISGATKAKLNDWFEIDLTMTYSYSSNDKVFKGAGGPLLGLLIWPATDNAKDYLTASGQRRQFFANLSPDSEVDNPYFSVNKNNLRDINNRVFTASSFVIKPLKGLSLTTRVGFDIGTFESSTFQHPSSARAYLRGGAFDQITRTTKNLNINTFARYENKILPKLNFNVLVGAETKQEESNSLSGYGEKFLEPDFASMNNTDLATRRILTTKVQRRVASIYSQAQFNYNRIAYLTLTGRNDWSSTLPVANNSFFYPSASLSVNFTDIKGLEGIKSILNQGKIRAAIAQVGRDSRPYKIYPALQYENLTVGGYRYGFTGPNFGLKPEMATSYEIGTELSFLNNRISLEFAYYKKQTEEQIVRDIRASYGTGFILTDMNGGVTRNHGYETMLTVKPILKKDFSWNVIANFDISRSKVVSLPRDLPESYNSDTWLYGNVRKSARPGHSLTAFSGYFYMRNDNGDILINPSTGLPYRESNFVLNGTDTWPKWTLGLTNDFSYKNFRLSFLLDFRKGGDVLNATEHYLTAKGLAMRTLDRETPRVIKGVMRDGLQNTANPTVNNIVVNPFYDSSYYTGISEEFFIERNINWIRLRDVTLAYTFPSKLLARQKFVKSASAFVTATDLFLITNYSGADPIANGNNAATVGSGGMGIDYGNFPISTGINFGVRIGL